jgi:hypothetical protein
MQEKDDLFVSIAVPDITEGSDIQTVNNYFLHIPSSQETLAELEAWEEKRETEYRTLMEITGMTHPEAEVIMHNLCSHAPMFMYLSSGEESRMVLKNAKRKLMKSCLTVRDILGYQPRRPKYPRGTIIIFN